MMIPTTLSRASSGSSSTTSNVPSNKLPQQQQQQTNTLTEDANFLSKYQVKLPQAVNARNAAVEPKGLPTSFEVSPCDVVCGRGKGSYNRPGNRAFRDIVIDHVPTYLAAKSKLDKSMVLSTIVERVREQNQGTTRFVKRRRDGTWYEIGDDLAREKVGHAIREAMSSMGRQSPTGSGGKQNNKTLNRKRQQQQQRMHKALPEVVSATNHHSAITALPADTTLSLSAPSLLADTASHFLMQQQQPLHAQQAQTAAQAKLAALQRLELHAKHSDLFSQQQAIFEDLLGARLMTQRAQLEIHQAKNLAQLLGL